MILLNHCDFDAFIKMSLDKRPWFYYVVLMIILYSYICLRYCVFKKPQVGPAAEPVKEEEKAKPAPKPSKPMTTEGKDV